MSLVSRMVATVIGKGGLASWSLMDAPDRPEGAGAAVAIVCPGCRDSPGEIPSRLSRDGLVDLRFHGDAHAWNRLFSTVMHLRELSERSIDPSRQLGLNALQIDTVRSYDHIAAEFAARWFKHPPLVALDKFIERLPAAARVLDAGCGPGHHAKWIAAHSHDVIGVDLSDEMLLIARKSVSAAQFHKMDIQALAFPPATFDGIWCAGAALHIPREAMGALLAGYRRSLRPDGLLGLNLQTGKPSEVVEYGNDRRFFQYYRDSAEVANMLGLAGFVVEDVDCGETARNTHGLDLRLHWTTLYARPRDYSQEILPGMYAPTGN